LGAAIVSPAIADGALAIDNSEIVAAGPRTEVASRFPGARVSDFGQAAILPGLVNAHSHLELTVCAAFWKAKSTISLPGCESLRPRGWR